MIVYPLPVFLLLRSWAESHPTQAESSVEIPGPIWIEPRFLADTPYSLIFLVAAPAGVIDQFSFS